jgi:hypothetical protein
MHWSRLIYYIGPNDRVRPKVLKKEKLWRIIKKLLCKEKEPVSEVYVTQISVEPVNF